MEEVRERRPTLYNRAYTDSNPPIRMPQEHLNGVMALDAMMNCRGGASLTSGGGIAAAALAMHEQVVALETGAEGSQSVPASGMGSSSASSGRRASSRCLLQEFCAIGWSRNNAQG